MTWSIVAFDKATGAFGAAVATKAFASGSFVPFVRAGVGAVGTQSLTNRYLAPVVLDGLARGLSPALAIERTSSGIIVCAPGSPGSRRKVQYPQ